MSSYEYDTSGVSSSLLGVGLLLSVMIATCSRAFKQRKEAKFMCSCPKCIERKEKKVGVNVFRIIFICAFVLLAVLMRNVLTKDYTREGTFNPYEILNVSRFAKKNEISRAYRRRIREARLSIRDKKKCKQVVQNILEAQRILSDKKKREKWDAFGETDKKERHIIAIPQWAMTKSTSLAFILMYILALGVALPKIVSSIWQISFAYSYVGLSYQSTEAMYHRMKRVKRCFSIENLIIWMSECCTEISAHLWRTPGKNVLQIQSVLEKEYGICTKKDSKPGFLICYSVLALQNKEIASLLDRNDIEHAQMVMQKATKGIRIISLALQQKEVFYLTHDLDRCIIQSIPDPKYWEMQYPFKSFEQVFVKCYEKRKEELPLNDLEKEIDKKMFKAKICAIDMYTPADGPISKEEYVTSSSSLNVRAIVVREGSEYVYTPPMRKKTKKEEMDIGDLSVLEADDYKEINPPELEKIPTLIRKEGSASAHAPLFQEPQMYSWTIVLEINKVPMMESPEFTPGEKETEIFFRLPPLNSFTTERRVTVDLRLLCKKFFNRESLSRKTLILK